MNFLKTVLRHKFDTGTSFQELLKQGHKLEQEFQSNPVKLHPQAVTASDCLSQILERLTQLEARFSSLEGGATASTPTGGKFCNYCKKAGHLINECCNLARKKSRMDQGNASSPTPGTGC